MAQASRGWRINPARVQKVLPSVKTAGTKRIAERYAKALFEVASQAGSLETVEKDLGNLGQALDMTPEFRTFLDNPLLAPAARAQACSPCSTS